MTTRYVQFGVIAILAVVCGVAWVKFDLSKRPETNKLTEDVQPEAPRRQQSKASKAEVVGTERPLNPFVKMRRGAEPIVALSPQAAIEQVAAEAYESMLDGPTLVVWLIDRTASAESLRSQALEELKSAYRIIYNQPKPMRGFAKPPVEQLRTVVAHYAGDVEYLCEPTSVEAEVQSALGKVSQTGGHEERTFSAIKSAMDKFGSARRPGEPVLIVVITDEAGSDPQLVDELAQRASKQALGIFVVGGPTMFGRTTALGGATFEEQKETIHGPETMRGEVVGIDDFRVTLDGHRMFSGFGPFALERLCRAGAGRYSVAWDSGAVDIGRFSPEMMLRYAPDYVMQVEYDKLIAENAARKALLQAAQLPRLEVTIGLESRFGKRDEAELKRKLDMAQRPAVVFASKLKPYVDTLTAGEKARETLTGARWQAAFDLAHGRVLATRVRFDGYNAALATLKQGKQFPDPRHTSWVLRATPNVTGDSALEKLASKSRASLERVMREHPGTPWALLASRELEAGFGWEWVSD